MKVFVTGVAGQLGHDVVNELIKRGHAAVCSDVVEPNGLATDIGTDESAHEEIRFELLDITDASAVKEVLTRVQPS